jgi:hypothetical protein
MVCNSHRRCFADYFFVQISGVAMNIIELAKQAGFSDADDKGVWITDGYWDKELKAFAALVAAHEREAIMKSIEELHPVENNPLLQTKPAAFWIKNFRQIVYTRGEA